MHIHVQNFKNSAVVKCSLLSMILQHSLQEGLLDNASCGEESPRHFLLTILLKLPLNLLQLLLIQWKFFMFFQQQWEYVKSAFHPNTKCSWTVLLLFKLYSYYINFSRRSTWINGGKTGGREKCQNFWAMGDENHRNVILAANYQEWKKLKVFIWTYPVFQHFDKAVTVSTDNFYLNSWEIIIILLE